MLKRLGPLILEIQIKCIYSTVQYSTVLVQRIGCLSSGHRDKESKHFVYCVNFINATVQYSTAQYSTVQHLGGEVCAHHYTEPADDEVQP